MTRFFSILAACALLASCSYFDEPEPVLDQPAAEKFDLTAGGGTVDSYAGSGAGSRQLFSGGSVEVFSLDGGAAASPVSAPSSSPVAPVAPVLREPSARAPSLFDESAPAASETPRHESTPERLQEPALIFFDHDSASLDEEDQKIIAEIFGFYTESKEAGESIGFDVEGHASTESSISDETTRKIVNLNMSADRAIAVAKGLIERGIPSESIKVCALGETGMAGNSDSRRVEIFPRPLR
ncbi:MAG: OmpA family protein [Alphaproteobacteria bacterium]|nr:OmpA family protein [Alphaproteobacteria bacterium]